MKNAWLSSSASYQEKLNSLPTGRSRKPKSKSYTLSLRIAARTTYTKPQISKNHAMIAIEDLRVSNMSKSAKGNAEEHGKNVKAKSGLNKSILDQGWYVFRRQLEYKQLWNGGLVVAVPAQYTSQTCPCCGHVSKDNRKTQAHFECVECGYTNNADIVGALNILERGHRLLACGESALAAWWIRNLRLKQFSVHPSNGNPPPS